ncbi:hypothetical protein ABK040_007574 [Willaertia magna]
MKQILAILLIALFAFVAVNAQQQQIESADNFLLDILKGAAKDYVNKNWDNEEQVESDKFFKSLGKLLKKSLPYLKAGVKDYVNNNFDEESDKFFKSLGKLLKKAVPYLKAGIKEYVNNNFDENVEAADIKFGKIFKKIGKIGLNLGKAYLRTKGIPLEDNEQADKFWNKLWGVVKQIGKGAIKSYVNQNFDTQSDLSLLKLNKLIRLVCDKSYPIRPRPIPIPAPVPTTTAADIKFGKIFKKIGKIGLNLGKAYLRTQGIPLEDSNEVKLVRRRFNRRQRVPRFRRERRIVRRRRTEVESDKFFKKIGKLFKKALPYLKAGVKDYVNNNFDEESDLIIPANWWRATL